MYSDEESAKRLELIKNVYNHKNFTECIKLIQEDLPHTTRDIYSRELLACCYYHQGNLFKALREYIKVPSCWILCVLLTTGVYAYNLNMSTEEIFEKMGSIHVSKYFGLDDTLTNIWDDAFASKTESLEKKNDIPVLYKEATNCKYNDIDFKAVSDLSLGGISLLDSKDKVFSIHNEPIKKIQEGRYVRWYYPYMQVVFDKSTGLVHGLATYSYGVRTKIGFQRGNTRQDVFRYYGEADISSNDKLSVCEYMLPIDDNSKGILRFAFTVEDDKLLYITIRIPSEWSTK